MNKNFDKQSFPLRRQFLFRLAFFGLLLVTVQLACSRTPGTPAAPWSASDAASSAPEKHPTAAVNIPVVRKPEDPIYTPTPDKPRLLPTPRTEPEEYFVQAGDTLGTIADRYGIGLDAMVEANNLSNPNLLEVGQTLLIPPPVLDRPGSAFKIIPDSELVYGPLSAGFDFSGFITAQGGYLAGYSEEVEGVAMTGAQIVERVAQEFSVNPRLLLAVLEYQSRWVTQANPAAETLDYPVGLMEERYKGLYMQLAWAANNLNRGYYTWRVNGIGVWPMGGGISVPIDPTINAGTAGVQGFFALLFSRPNWDEAVSEAGIFKTYQSFFGYPFDLAVEPLLPNGMMQPRLQLPFEPGVEWSYTGGPHGAWGSGSAWGALDFAPPGEGLGCIPSDAWVVAVADGKILRAGNGAVVQELDEDGLEQTGWVVLYMHIESRERVQAGAFLRAGERIGHPSCEGGFSSGTHVHIARKYNGEWLSADQTIPFILDGWVSRGTGVEYDGFLQRNQDIVEAIEGAFPENQIKREP